MCGLRIDVLSKLCDEELQCMDMRFEKVIRNEVDEGSRERVFFSFFETSSEIVLEMFLKKKRRISNSFPARNDSYLQIFVSYPQSLKYGDKGDCQTRGSRLHDRSRSRIRGVRTFLYETVRREYSKQSIRVQVPCTQTSSSC